MPATRSLTGNHVLLPHDVKDIFVPQRQLGTVALSSWSFGSGTVIWRIWPAVVFHTLFAALIVWVSRNVVSLAIPNVMLTVLGVVIGFVLAYRVSSGYDRYWFGRCFWSDIVRNSRTLGRLIWFHVPLNIPVVAGGVTMSKEEIEDTVMREKRMALDLIEGFAVAVKHHLRGETGVYYEDLYHLIKPLTDEKPHKHHHEHEHEHEQHPSQPPQSQPVQAQSQAPPLKSRPSRPDLHPNDANHYGTFNGGEHPQQHPIRRRSHASLASSVNSDSEPDLLPASAAETHRANRFRHISSDLIPFSSVLSNFIEMFKAKKEDWKEDIKSCKPRLASAKHRPEVAAVGNIPLTILQSLSEYLSVLESRGVVPGTSMGPMIGTIQMFEDSLSGLERILTTPLPFVYSVHIRHAIWIYLFFLPTQLVDQFGWHTVSGVAIAAFFYLGFLAAGEEIEQPFGYDENDLDIDTFIRHIIHVDIQALKGTACPNVKLPEGGRAKRRALVDAARLQEHKEHPREALDGVFGQFHD